VTGGGSEGRKREIRRRKAQVEVEKKSGEAKNTEKLSMFCRERDKTKQKKVVLMRDRFENFEFLKFNLN
jgi:hypothetical protein